MRIHSIHHVQLAFPEAASTQVRHFYTELLGLHEWTTPASSALRFLAGSQRIDLVPTGQHEVPHALSHLALEVENLPKLRSRLLTAGYSITENRPLPGHLRFYTHDPAGNQLEFLEPDTSQSQTI